MSIWEKVPAEERKTFPFDAALYDWEHYFQDVHFPTVVRMARAETAAGKGKQPTGSTAVKSESSSVRAAVERRKGRADVLAVFDVDGTLVETNVVEYFLWMRLRAQPLGDWPGFMAQMLREAPRWLYLERRSRSTRRAMESCCRRASRTRPRFRTWGCWSSSARRWRSILTRGFLRSPDSVAGGSSDGRWRRETGGCRCPTRGRLSIGRR